MNSVTTARIPDLAALLEGLDLRAEWVGLRYVSRDYSYRSFRDGRPAENRSGQDAGIMVEVLCDGQFAYAASACLEPGAVADAARRAADLARRSAPYALFRFDVSARPPARGSYVSTSHAPELSARSTNELLRELNERMSGPEILSCDSHAWTTQERMAFVSSNGSNIEQSVDYLTLDYAATAGVDGVTQRRTANGSFARSYQGGAELIDRVQLLSDAERVAAEARELCRAPECPTGKMDLVLAPDQMMLQIHESVGHPLELDRILGDERNYAGFSFVRPKDFGRLQYGSRLMNIVYDPAVPGEFASYGFDDTGLAASRTHLIREGLLLAGLGGVESQLRSQLPGVAVGRAMSWNRAPIDRMANLNLEPGPHSREEIISSVERGVLMQSNRSWSIDDYRRKFQFGCEYARLIENGRLAGVVRNPNYRGVTNEFWARLAMVGDASTREIYGTPFCGKGEPNQLIRVGHAAPLCLFRGIDVFGGGA